MWSFLCDLVMTLKLVRNAQLVIFHIEMFDIIDSYFYISFLNVYYITVCKLHEFFKILSEVKNWQMCYLVVVTLAVAHYIVNLPSDAWRDFNYWNWLTGFKDGELSNLKELLLLLHLSMMGGLQIAIHKWLVLIV